MKISLFVFCGALFLTNIVNGQDLFDYSHSLKYGDYLFNQEKYQEALHEYGRCAFLNKDSTSIDLHQKMLRSYNRLGQFDNVEMHWQRVRMTSLNLIPLNNDLLISFARSGNYKKGYDYLNVLQFDQPENKDKYTILFASLLHDYEKSSALSSDFLKMHPEDNYVKRVRSIVDKRDQQKNKKAAVAVMLSAVIPGSGKIYTGRVKDGIFAFVMTSISAYQSYRGFSDKGSKSVIGWVYGGLTSVLYLGNLYGSGKAVKNYNQKQARKYEEDLVHLGF